MGATALEWFKKNVFLSKSEVTGGSVKFSLPSFIKFCLLPGNQQITEIQKKMTLSSGYDYYWTLHKAIAAHARGAQSDEVEAILLSASSPTEQHNNRTAYEAYYKRFGFKKSLSYLSRPVSASFEEGLIEVQFNPLFEVTEKETRNVYVIWAIQKPDLQQSYAAMGCLMLRNAYKKTSLANAKFHIFDLFADRDYSEKQVKQNTEAMLDAELGKAARIIRNQGGV